MSTSSAIKNSYWFINCYALANIAKVNLNYLKLKANNKPHLFNRAVDEDSSFTTAGQEQYCAPYTQHNDNMLFRFEIKGRCLF